jgi:membrane protease YdiL (CAAX protease family)
MTSELGAAAVPTSRSWWNAGGFIGLVGVFLFGYVFLSSVVANTPATAGSVALVIPPVLLAGAVLWANRIFVRREGWTLGAIGFDQWPRRLRESMAGLLGGTGLVVVWSGMFAICTRSGWRATGEFDLRGALMVLALTFFVNASEELVYRGYLFVRIARSVSEAVAILATSVVFFLYHVQSGIPWSSAFAGVFTCGVLYAVIFARWRSVPAALGFHWGNNLAQHLLGLRISPMTLVEPSGAASGRTATAVLISVAAVNLLLASGLLFWPRNQRRGQTCQELRGGR